MKRPFFITANGLLFIIAGTTGIFYHASDLKQFTTSTEVIWVFAVRLLAIIGGVFLLRGANWSRWLLLVWMAYHTGLSFFHTPLELIIHISFLALAAYALFNSKSSAYFQKTQA